MSTFSTLSNLSPDELSRAKRFHFEKERFNFVRCRSALRSLLSRYLGIAPKDLCFEYQRGGKPELAAQQNPRGLQFSVSHSSRMALIAVSAGHRIGVDIEKESADVDVIALAEHCFSTGELAALRALPDQLRQVAFFACWTRKEAFLKAIGEGLSFPLAEFSVTINPDLAPALEEIRGDREAGNQWFLADLSVASGYRAAVAVESSYSRLETYTL